MLKFLDWHTVRKYKYAENIWLYLTQFYKQSDCTAQMLALKQLIIWKMNSEHSVKEADQEVSYYADWVHQISDEVQFFWLMKVVFLNSLLKEYESSCQLLEFHVKMLNQMIETLSAVKVWMKDEKKSLYEMNIVTETARLFKAEWLKKMKCYNCRELDHLARNCKKSKKNQKSDSSEDDKKTENKKSDNQAKKMI